MLSNLSRMTIDPQLAAEQRARVEIDRQLVAAGWAVVDRKELDPFVPSAVREVIMAPGHGSRRLAAAGGCLAAAP